MSVRAVLHRRGETSKGSQAHRMDDKLDGRVAKALDRRCSGGLRQWNLFCGGAHTMPVIERYPVRLVNAVLRVLRQEVKKRYPLEAGQHVDEHDVWLRSPEYYEEIYEAITGARLDPALVAKARNIEMRFLVDELDAYKNDSVNKCLKTTGKRPIPVKWVDVDEGDAQRPEVRSRLAVAETKHGTTHHVLMFIDITRAPALYYATTGVGAATGGRSA